MTSDANNVNMTQDGDTSTWNSKGRSEPLRKAWSQGFKEGLLKGKDKDFVSYVDLAGRLEKLRTPDVRCFVRCLSPAKKAELLEAING